jgi:hypothetical protein
MHQDLILRKIRNIIPHLFYLLFFICFSADAVAQNYELDIKKIDLDEYPKIKAEVWSRDPRGLDTSKFAILESGKEVKLSFKGKRDSVQSKKNKSIVFLVLNPGRSARGEAELEWYKRVLRESLNNTTITKGDKIDILDFNQQFSGQILYPSSLSLTDDVNIINLKIDALSPRYNDPSACAKGGSLVLPAIDQTIALIKEKNLDMPTGIVVISDDVVCGSNQIEGLLEKSKRNNIPIYSITFSAFRTPWNSIQQLTEKSFGEYFQDFAYGGSTENSISQLTGYLNSFLTRHKGILYKYEWTTKLPKGGKQETLNLKYKEVSTDYDFVTPKRNIIEWVIDNPIYGALIFVFVLLIIGGIILYTKRQKEQQKRQKEQLYSLQRDQEAKAASLSNKLQQQEQELNQIREREQREKFLIEEQKRAELKEREQKELIRQMKLRGVLPTLDCMTPDQNFMFTITKPEIIIGRSKECDLVLNYQTVSKKHCRIIFVTNGYVLEDLRSSNGTTVNNRSIQKIGLKHGDVIRLGEVVLNFRS